MTKIHIPHDAIVFVGDGRKALFLRNEGDEKFPNLKTESVFLDKNPPTHEQGTDRPGRSHASVGPGRSAVESTDWHDLEEHHFARVVAEALEKLVRERRQGAADRCAPAHPRQPAPGAAQGRQGPHHRRGRQGFHQAGL
jgi:protein required for attachment to host cells